jgi:hypothetical protein
LAEKDGGRDRIKERAVDRPADRNAQAGKKNIVKKEERVAEDFCR